MKNRKPNAPRAINVGRGFTVQFLLTNAGIIAEWTPDIPDGRDAAAVAGRYRDARDAFVARALPTLRLISQGASS